MSFRPDTQTVASVLTALAVWDLVMYATLGTSPVVGFVLGGQTADSPMQQA
jgi:hypothetical protein